MCSWKGNAAFFGALLLFVPLALSVAPSRRQTPTQSGPKDVSEVVAIARQMGWHCASDRKDGDLRTRRIILSEAPLTLACINTLFCGPGVDPTWIGKVAVNDEGSNRLDTLSDHGNLVNWGNFLLYGDARLIEKLVQFSEANCSES